METEEKQEPHMKVKFNVFFINIKLISEKLHYKQLVLKCR